MTQDYARRKRPRKRKKNTRKKKTSLPPWLWLATGLCIGLLGGLLFHLSQLPREATAVAEQQAKAEADGDSAEEVEFNFYTLLPQREVMVSAQPRQPARDAAPAAARKPEKARQIEAGYNYYLQAGSFQKKEQAEKRRVQLLLLDLEANIEKVRHQGKSWYRVQSGPYQSTSQLASVRNTLGNEGIDTMVTKRKLD